MKKKDKVVPCKNKSLTFLPCTKGKFKIFHDPHIAAKGDSSPRTSKHRNNELTLLWNVQIKEYLIHKKRRKERGKNR